MEEEKKTDELPAATCQGEFYDAAIKYWNEIPATINGMLGGFGFISEVDCRGSMIFLKRLFELADPPSRNCALDCGAGIGRVTREVLLKWFRNAELVEQNPRFVQAAHLYLRRHTQRIGNFFPVGLQNFSPLEKKYDVIWCQWVLGHLLDDDLIDFLRRCSTGLNSCGLIVVKENVTESQDYDKDVNDSSVTRPLSHLRSIFHKAGLQCVREERQFTFPGCLYPVYMFALKPNV